MVVGLLRCTSEITDFLLLGGYGAATETNLAKYGVTCVIDATDIPRAKLPTGVEYMKVAVDDNDFAPIDRYFDLAADLIEEHRKHNGKTLVHCAAGISRSATIVIIYFTKHRNMTLREAYLLVQEKREIISPNSGFWRQMVAYEKRLKGANSVELLKGRYKREVPDVYFHKNPKPAAIDSCSSSKSTTNNSNTTEKLLTGDTVVKNAT